MTTRERPVDRGIRLATRDRVRAGTEIRDARVAAGISIRAIAHAAGMSPSHAARVERGAHAAASVEQLARLAAAVGLDARLRLYPGPDPIRDRAHVALLDRLRARLSPRARLRTEVPIPIPAIHVRSMA